MAERKVVYSNADGFLEEINPASDNLVSAAATANGQVLIYGQSGAVLAGLDLNSNVLSGVANPVAATDAVNLQTMQTYLQGLDPKGSVIAVATANITLSGAQTIDGVSVVAGDRVLVTGQTTAADNGIYVAAAGAWARAADLATGEDAASVFLWVQKGTANADTSWVCTSDTGSAVVGTDALVFTQFSQATTISAGDGLTKTGTTIDVGDGAGIKVNADSIEVELSAIPGLEFDAVGAGGKLQAKVNSAKNMLLEAAGLGVEVDGVTLENAVGGIKVIGLPSLFEINEIAVSANVTAANLSELTGGSATTLHSHASLPIDLGTASGALVKGNVVYFSAANTVAVADKGTDTAKGACAIMSAAAADTDPAFGVQSGIVTGVGSGWTPGGAVFLSTAGGLTQTAPTSGWIVQVGHAKNATDLIVGFKAPVKKA